ncbi:MAG: hypothetical protein KatS3mg078_2230 [Deltaproteobacteria bacterium]|jgi:preprotein translocase subunit YajC|nr:MAG: hypothetical protein KatS3mg078_2230 [Deltaproteobacteria bacterium]
MESFLASDPDSTQRRSSILRRVAIGVTLAVVYLYGCFPPQGQDGASGGSPFVALVPLVLIFLLFYVLILRPQQKQHRERMEMLKNLKRGDTVITSGGLYGKILNISGDVVTLEIAKGVSVKVARSGIAGLANLNDQDKKGKEDKSEK